MNLYITLSLLIFTITVDAFSVTNLKKIAAQTAIIATGLLSTSPLPALANNNPDPKMRDLPDSAIAKVVTYDVQIKQALITADFTRGIYSETASFKDEIDIYPIDKYIKGTKALFVAEKSHVDLTAPVSVNPTTKTVTFKFSEVLCFNIPILLPKVSLTGYVELFRENSDDGYLVTRSVEHWDQPVGDVLKTAKFF